MQLWITFKICIFVISNNSVGAPHWCTSVVNYFQNLYLCDLKQLTSKGLPVCIRCELLSKFVSLWLPTAGGKFLTQEVGLWITFKICIFVISNNNINKLLRRLSVVNYFQNLYLFDFQQQRDNKSLVSRRCELLSKFVSLWFPTTNAGADFWAILLWITFKICIFVTPNNLK